MKILNQFDLEKVSGGDLFDTVGSFFAGFIEGLND